MMLARGTQQGMAWLVDPGNWSFPKTAPAPAKRWVEVCQALSSGFMVQCTSPATLSSYKERSPSSLLPAAGRYCTKHLWFDLVVINSLPFCSCKETSPTLKWESVPGEEKKKNNKI